MQVTVYGTRGSYPVCRREMVRYGGNTTCWLVETADEVIIIDGGSGIVGLGRKLVERYPNGRTIHICLTHPHWDHVLGFPFFEPFFTPGFDIVVHGADSESKRLESILESQHKPSSFAVSFEHLSASIRFDRLLPGEGRQIGGVKVQTLQLNHPGVDLGYRFESRRGTFVMLTDLAPIAGNHLGAGMKERAASGGALEQSYYAALVELVSGADLVSFDTNFTDEEIQGRFHWGHSTPSHALELMSQLDSPPALILAHHDPDHDDIALDAIYEQTKQRGRDRRIEVLIAKEGGSFQL